MSVQVSTQVDAYTKQRFDGVCESMGISPPDALRMFIVNVADHNTIPFSAEPPKKVKRTREEVFGCMRGQFKMAEDFDAPLEDFKEYMEPAAKKPKKSRAEMFGCMGGDFDLPEDFDAPLEDFREYME